MKKTICFVSFILVNFLCTVTLAKALQLPYYKVKMMIKSFDKNFVYANTSDNYSIKFQRSLFKKLIIVDKKTREYRFPASDWDKIIIKKN